MKKFTSIILTAVMLLSMMCITAFAEDNSVISITFTPPKVGDEINPTQLLITSNSTSLSNASGTVQKIYDSAVLPQISTITTIEAYGTFSQNTSSASGVYQQKSYIATFFVNAGSIPTNATFSFPEGIEGEALCTNTTSTILYGYFVFTPTSGTAADTSTPNSESESHSVYATYEEGESPTTIYSVDITWESMEFTYTAASKGTWNTEEHKYEDPQPASWSFENNSITVVNHSNAAITADFSYAPADGFENIEGTFVDEEQDALTPSEITLSSAENSGSGGITSTQVYLLLDGDLPSSVNAKTRCGTVTVTIQ